MDHEHEVKFLAMETKLRNEKQQEVHTLERKIHDMQMQFKEDMLMVD